MNTPAETTTFTYGNSAWEDELTSVNGTSLTYDANGNVLTYGNMEFEWTNGRVLSEITVNPTDPNGTADIYSYTYDESGIRTSKTVNGVATYFTTKDGIILSQTDGTNTMYFQYDNSGNPTGFIYNGNQYFYLTNQMGDIFAITNAAGTVIANYTYGAWGELLSTTPATANDATQLAIANANPLRYRGYYYDSETKNYYIQSRFYSPKFARFLSPDDSEVLLFTSATFAGFSLFSYCGNDPINYYDAWGLARAKVTYKKSIRQIGKEYRKFTIPKKIKVSDIRNRARLASFASDIAFVAAHYIPDLYISATANAVIFIISKIAQIIDLTLSNSQKIGKSIIVYINFRVTIRTYLVTTKKYEGKKLKLTTKKTYRTYVTLVTGGVIKLSNLLFILFWIVSIVVGVLLIITKKKQYLVAYIIASAILYVVNISSSIQLKRHGVHIKKVIFGLIPIVVLILFLWFGTTNIPEPTTGSVRFDYTDNTVQVLQEDLKQLYKNMNHRVLRWDNSSCGFGEDVSMTLIDENGQEHHFWFACDTCPIVYYKEQNRYFNLSNKEDAEIKEILSTYGFYFPCI